jgi:hypothetical protein
MIRQQTAEKSGLPAGAAEGEAGYVAESCARGVVQMFAPHPAGNIGLFDVLKVATVRILYDGVTLAVGGDADGSVAHGAGYPDRALGIEGQTVRDDSRPRLSLSTMKPSSQFGRYPIARGCRRLLTVIQSLPCVSR